MITAQELEKAIEGVGASITELGRCIGETGNVRLAVAYREHALKGLWHFIQECSLIVSDVVLEDIP